MSVRTLWAFFIVLSFALLSHPLISTAAGGKSDAAGDEKTDLNYAQVLSVEAIQSPDGQWCIYATVRHNDEGWDHYANAWQAVDQEGEELAWRLLAHPHDYEQPFERDECGVVIPADVTELTVQAKCNVHGFGGSTVVVDMSVSEGEKFKVVRNKEQPREDGR